MEITLDRFGFGIDSTLGELRLDGLHGGFTLEDERRRTKVPGETCIPTGRYEIRLRTVGELHRRYKARFPDLHRGMLWLQEVPGFQWVYVHIGNDESDTDGCPLVGRYPLALPDGEFKVAESTPIYLDLYRRTLEAMDRGEPVYITITEREPAP
jgi:hypothetical protein